MNQKKLININGGCFAFDFGWFVANSLMGNFSDPVRYMDAVTDYAIHYATKE